MESSSPSFWLSTRSATESSIIRTFIKESDELISSENSFIGFRVLANASGNKVNWVPKKSY